jgi:predicted 3-demethylubiquinone-9 3-methyltransferase (glyoxalase superfamily)
VEDKFGVSWQVICAGEIEASQKITPVLMFVGKVCGRTEEAANFYVSVFKNSPGAAKTGAATKADILARYGNGEEPNKKGTVKYA